MHENAFVLIVDSSTTPAFAGTGKPLKARKESEQMISVAALKSCMLIVIA